MGDTAIQLERQECIARLPITNLIYSFYADGSVKYAVIALSLLFKKFFSTWDQKINEIKMESEVVELKYKKLKFIPKILN